MHVAVRGDSSLASSVMPQHSMAADKRRVQVRVELVAGSITGSPPATTSSGVRAPDAVRASREPRAKVRMACSRGGISIGTGVG